MEEITPEKIQSAADEARRGGFGDFMFRDPGFNRGASRRRTTKQRTSSRGTTSRKNTSRRNTSGQRNTSRKNTSRRKTSRRRTTRRNTIRRRNCKTTFQGNWQIERCWDDSNQSYFRMKSR
ncbi:CotG/ExsB N-terminal domain-containing protein [Neobacillus sp. NPDC058068]|uniref:CotG/ExsB N-terminal domain-containing protein n=1 Tax=Neobacillus sp. NPDC058068 TaxID=3346325 RepID=UPI0036DA7FA3